MDEWFNRHSVRMLVHMKPSLCIRYISYEICLCTCGRNNLCSWQSLAEPKVAVTLIKNKLHAAHFFWRSLHVT